MEEAVPIYVIRGISSPVYPLWGKEGEGASCLYVQQAGISGGTGSKEIPLE